jgi:ABC-2 type transport system permease protein
MRNALTIAQKELNTYFASPVAYVVTAFFLLVMGYFFYLLLVLTSEASMRGVFGNMAVILLFVTPFLTMRLLAEEQRMGTIELLLTSPVRDWEVVLGKYLGALAFLLFMLALTLFYPLLLSRVGSPDWGPVATGYLGVLLIGAACLAIGVFASSLSQNQIVTGFIAFAILIIGWLLGAASNAVGGGPVGSALNYLALNTHFDDFIRGVVDSQHVVYYFILIAVFLFLATRVVEAKRWR